MKKLMVLGLLLLSTSVFAQDVYRMETTIGGNVFGDLLVIDSYTDRDFEGSVTVPGVFTSKIEKSFLQYTWSGQNLRFQIQVHENNESYNVQYKLFLGPGGLISGTLSKDNEVIGTIKGAILHENK